MGDLSLSTRSKFELFAYLVLRTRTPYLISMRRNLYLLVLIVFGLSSCQSLDDDSEYEIKTYASFLKVENPAGELSLAKHSTGLLEESWNAKAGIPDGALSDASMEENEVWLASASQKEILTVGPSSGNVIERFSQLPIAPHFFSVGEKQILICDSAANKIALIKRRNGKVQVLEFEGKPGQCIYNSGKFYLQVNAMNVAILDEQAMTLRANIELTLPINYLQFDRYNSAIVSAKDSTKDYQTLITFNGDFEVGTFYEVLWQKMRATPYFAATFGTEYLRSIHLRGSEVRADNNVVLATNATDFEADFFEGTLFYLSNDSLYVKDILSDANREGFLLNGKLRGAFHQYAKE